MRLLALALPVVVALSGCWRHGQAYEGSSASRGTGNELLLPPELGKAARLRMLVSTVPVIGSIDDGPTPVIIRGQLSPRRAARMVALAHLIHRDVTTRLVAHREQSHPPIDLVLYDDDPTYQALALGYSSIPAGQGFYRPDARVAVVNLSRGAGNLSHELVHPLVLDDFPHIPAWLNEGIASMYGAAQVHRGRLHFVSDYRLYDLRDALAEGALPARDRLAVADRPELYGPDGTVYYAASQHVVLYLQHTGHLAWLYRTMRADLDRARPALAAAVDWPRFVRWARRLRVGRTPPRP